MWLYIPPEMTSAASRFAPASAASNSASTSQNQTIELFVTSSGKPSLRPLSWQGWKTRPWIRRLSGMTLPPSTARLGVERFISSLPDIPASPSASPAGARARTIPATSGLTSGESSLTLIPSGASSKTSKGICPWEPTRFSGTFDRWALQSKRACSARQKSARPTSVGGSSLWPTPTKSIYCTKIEMELVNDCFKMRDDAAAAGSQFGIGKAARLWTQIWMLMQACGATPTRPFSFPSSRPLHLSLNAGHRSSPGDLTFNPNFSDWIMGWPIGWTDPTQPVTAWSAWLQRMRGELSKMPI
ncbi:hypothetical protein BN949_02619 [Agrobacterium tumefaciens]|nr:hypothetical protein BN949_02619 [Agrobacterium tumefaciens]